MYLSVIKAAILVIKENNYIFPEGTLYFARGQNSCGLAFKISMS